MKLTQIYDILDTTDFQKVMYIFLGELTCICIKKYKIQIILRFGLSLVQFIGQTYKKGHAEFVYKLFAVRMQSSVLKFVLH